jgi:hypothetical protein
MHTKDVLIVKAMGAHTGNNDAKGGGSKMC